MAVKNKDKKQPKGGNLRAAVVAQVEELLTRHMNGILQFVSDAEDKKEKVSFGVLINCAESEPQVEVSIRYSQSVTDTRKVVLDDPDQGTFEPVTQAADEETKKRRGRNTAKVSGTEAEPDAEANPVE